MRDINHRTVDAALERVLLAELVEQPVFTFVNALFLNDFIAIEAHQFGTCVADIYNQVHSRSYYLGCKITVKRTHYKEIYSFFVQRPPIFAIFWNIIVFPYLI